MSKTTRVEVKPGLPHVSLRVIAVRSDSIDELMPSKREGVNTHEADVIANTNSMNPVSYRLRIEDEQGNAGNYCNMVWDQFGTMLELICRSVESFGTDYFPRYIETKVKI